MAEEELLRQLSLQKRAAGGESANAPSPAAGTLRPEAWDALLQEMRQAAARASAVAVEAAPAAPEPAGDEPRQAPPAASPLDSQPSAEPPMPATQIRPPRHVGLDGAVALAPNQAPSMQQRLATAALAEPPLPPPGLAATEPATLAATLDEPAPADHAAGDRWLVRPPPPSRFGGGRRRDGLRPLLIAVAVSALVGTSGTLFALRHLSAPAADEAIAAAPGALSEPAASGDPVAAAPAEPSLAMAADGKDSVDRVPGSGIRQIEIPAPGDPGDAITVVQRGTPPAGTPAAAAAPHPIADAEAGSHPRAAAGPAPRPSAASQVSDEAGPYGAFTPGRGADSAVSAYAPVSETVDAHAALTATSPATVLKAVNMRAAPDNGAASLRILQQGTGVAVVDCSYWCEVLVDGQRGYIFNRFLDGALPRSAPGR
jgi:hypothetical protein